MSLFIETILIRDGIVRNLFFHETRMARTLARFFSRPPIDLSRHLLNLPQSGSFRCRVTYGKSIESVEWFPYERVKKTKLLAIESDLNYTFKFKERSELEKLSREAAENGCDEALIVKNSLIADTTIANVAFFDGRFWYTPALPLLQGTMRARLLQSRLIRPATICPEDLKHFSKMALFNALSGFYIAGNPAKIIQ
jgi:4-amino-4-deoxychorismate lyase